MKLLYSPTSPFARKVRVVAHELDLAQRIDLVAGDPFADDGPVPLHNPLSKIPVLVLDDGSPLYDSPVICEYLASLVPASSIVPLEGQPRWAALRCQALADGIAEATLGIRLDSLRQPERRNPAATERHLAAIRRGLVALSDHVKPPDGDLTIGDIAGACALGYLDLRLAAEDWRATQPGLAAWYEAMCQRPSLRDTAHPG